jgi:Mn2+/Fe2+ NRAMP family transporter
MGELVNKRRTILVGVVIAVALVVLNLKLVLDTVVGFLA